MLTALPGCAAQPDQPAGIAQGDVARDQLLAFVLGFLCCLVTVAAGCWRSSWIASCRASAAEARFEGACSRDDVGERREIRLASALEEKDARRFGARFCTCGCLLGPALSAEAVPFQRGRGAWPIYEAPDVAPGPGAAVEPPAQLPRLPAYAVASCAVAALMVLLFWAAEGLIALASYALSPSIVRRKQAGSRSRARAAVWKVPPPVVCARPLPASKRPVKLATYCEPPPGLSIIGSTEQFDAFDDDGRLLPRCDLQDIANAELEVLGDVEPPYWPPPPPAPYTPMLTEGEFSRLVRNNLVAPPVSWVNTTQERILHAGLAMRARKLTPLTVAEVEARANIHVMNERAYVDTFAWPQWNVAVGSFVQVNGLVSRRDLEGRVFKVTGLCRSTQRIGILLDGGGVIYVRIERLSPAAAPESAAILDAATVPRALPPAGPPPPLTSAPGANSGFTFGPAPSAEAAEPVAPTPPAAEIVEGDGGTAYDHSFFLNLAAVVLAFVAKTGVDEVGVSVDSIVADMANTAPWASVGDIYIVVDKLVYDGDCYTTIDAYHVLAL